jgi:hypothetical protein
MTNGPTQVAGKIGQALSFISVKSQYVEVANQANFNFERTNPFSISSWVKWTGITDQYIVSTILTDPTYLGYSIYLGGSSSGVSVELNNDVGAIKYINVATDNSTVTRGIWTHVVMTYSGSGIASEVKVYINGANQALTINRDTLGANTILNSQALDIGSG